MLTLKALLARDDIGGQEFLFHQRDRQNDVSAADGDHGVVQIPGSASRQKSVWGSCRRTAQPASAGWV